MGWKVTVPEEVGANYSLSLKQAPYENATDALKAATARVSRDLSTYAEKRGATRALSQSIQTIEEWMEGLEEKAKENEKRGDRLAQSGTEDGRNRRRGKAEQGAGKSDESSRSASEGESDRHSRKKKPRETEPGSSKIDSQKQDSSKRDSPKRDSSKRDSSGRGSSEGESSKRSTSAKKTSDDDSPEPSGGPDNKNRAAAHRGTSEWPANPNSGGETSDEQPQQNLFG
jgi:hypothetical protein